ncbi:hypothetical protein [Dinghuibacter silviterrae]|uniref:Outer membrane efflux protein n=1 Tax=Dinghuibacter silviterrae TaxID=1539049 RepID=A0A4R8DQB4_9BACT|nr:hypothetical protein [Dinghuibacter silviterrae]TDX00109.1 hypothetical protein EDB95_1126 [Dinghuibacter silviterrae]
MKHILLLSCASGLFLIATGTHAQTVDTLTDKQMKDKVLGEIQTTLDRRTKSIDSTVTNLDARVDALDKSILETKDVKEKADKLVLRVQALEDRQKAVDENDLYIYQANYQSAIVNLVSMEREIKPLILFNSTKTFFDQLGQASNPMNYPGYKDFFAGFNKYMENNKAEETGLGVAANVLSSAGTEMGAVPVTGPMTFALFSGMSSYMSSMSGKHKELREQSEKMVLLTMKVSQFDYDQGLIENEWAAIEAELDNLQKIYASDLSQDLATLKIEPKDFQAGFSQESDAESRYQYLTMMRQSAADFATAERQKNPKDWKQKIYYQMMDVQSLKMRFGQITFRISENIGRYESLFDKYKLDPQIGPEIVNLQGKLSDLRNTFDKAFDPLDYIASTTKMYKVG